MIDADVILLVTTPNVITYYVSTVAIRTCAASTKARIHVWHNTTPPGKYRDKIKNECELLGINYAYKDGYFSLAGLSNEAIKTMPGKYVAVGCADVIYFPNWLENIVELWEENPDYKFLVNYSFDTEKNGCVRHTAEPEKKIVNTWNPSSGVMVFKPGNGFLYDEQFPFWEMDADLTLQIEKNGWKAGYCCNARADHMICGIRDHLDLPKHTGISNDEFFRESKLRLKSKWGEAYKGGG